MDRSPEVREAAVESFPRRLVGEISQWHEGDVCVFAMRKAPGLLGTAIGDVTDRTRVQQCADDSRAECTGPAGYHHLTILEVHRSLPTCLRTTWPEDRPPSRIGSAMLFAVTRARALRAPAAPDA